MTKALTYVEVDVPAFSGSGPDQTFRFAKPTAYLPGDIECIPSLEGVNFSPAVVSLGESLGQRASLTASLSDHRHVFAGESYDSGSFWGKWRARYGQRLRGRALRWIQGEVGQTLAEMTTRYFVIESTAGPTYGGGYSITAKDPLKLADNDRSQAPLLSEGFLVDDVAAGDGSFTLSPSGIGATYPASGYAAIGGEEIVAFTRSGDVMTITRAQLGTAAAAHDAQDRVQLVLRYSGEDPADIIYDLLSTYAGIPTAYLPVADWLIETGAFLGRLYGATITEPTGVNQLVTELIQAAALAMWWEPTTQTIRLQVLRSISTDAALFDEQSIIDGSLGIEEQPGARISQAWVYYGQRNPLLKLDELRNFRSALATIDADSDTDYGSSSIKKINARWIPAFGRTTAERLSDILISRFRDPPRRFSFALSRAGGVVPVLGGGYRIAGYPLQDVMGVPSLTTIQLTRVLPDDDRYVVEAEEMLIDTQTVADETVRPIIIDSSINDVDLRDLHDSLYPEVVDVGSPALTIRCTILENVIVGSTSTAIPAFDVGIWPAGLTVEVIVKGRIEGRGGQGGDAGRNGHFAGYPGANGGTAFYTRYPVVLELDQGAADVWGGGGGGAGGSLKDSDKQAGGGGGGAGQLPGSGGATGNGPSNGGSPGTTEAGGAGGPNTTGEAQSGGNGGGPALAGENRGGGSWGAVVSGGSPGTAIDGISYVTKVGTGDVRGSEVN